MIFTTSAFAQYMGSLEWYEEEMGGREGECESRAGKKASTGPQIRRASAGATSAA